MEGTDLKADIQMRKMLCEHHLLTELG